MSTPGAVVVEGMVTADGTLEVPGKVPLPAGRVRITVTPVVDLPADDPFWQMMRKVWAIRQEAGLEPRSEEEVEGERRAVREEWEARMKEIERIHEEAEAFRRAQGRGK